MRDIITGRMSSLSSLQAGNLILKRVEVKISEDENVRRFLTEEMIVKRKMRILSLVLTALMVTGLGGCGSTDKMNVITQGV